MRSRRDLPLALACLSLTFLATACGDDASSAPTTPTSTDAGTGDALASPPDATPSDVCGNERIAGAETCDDGNDAGGDGCSAECTIEEGFRCEGEPSTCTAICSDGLVRGSEQCDDGNVNPDDGCGPACTIENGYSCDGEPSTCAPGCGDGVRIDPEGCDDGNDDAGDGCDPTCQVEDGFACTGSGPDSCAPVCGDGMIVADESCDDEDTEAGDGCDASCTQETGWTCEGEPSKCTPVCGDGVVLGSEACDDGDVEPGDGCSDSCQVETGFACAGHPTSTCAPVCGDGLRVGDEACDDGNLTDEDACSSTCELACGAPSMQQHASGSCYFWGPDEDRVSWQEARERCALVGVGFDLAVPALIEEMVFLNAGLASHTTGTWVGGTDAAEEGVWAWINGEAWVYEDGQPPWRPGEPNDAGGNEDCAELNQDTGQAGMNDIACGALRTYLCERADTSALCRNGLVEGSEQCDDGNTVAGDGCDLFCFTEPGFACDGTPSVCEPVCGDALVVAGEPCDDGNTDPGDGCDASCQLEPGYVCEGEPSTCDQSCGNGAIAPSEECDDGNVDPGDGCDANCAVEHGFACVSEPSTCTSTCGDGVVASDEACDDGNTEPGDGCADCAVSSGYSCYGEPSICEAGTFAFEPDLFLVIEDNQYDGTLTSMSCVPLDITAAPGDELAFTPSLELYLTHTYVGDLTIKIVSPSGLVATVLQRPAGDRPNPAGDDGSDCCGDDSDIVSTTQIIFQETAVADAESMGAGLGDGDSICSQASCTFAANADQASDSGLSGLVGESMNGLWQVCFGDSESHDFGTVHSVRLQLTSE